MVNNSHGKRKLSYKLQITDMYRSKRLQSYVMAGRRSTSWYPSTSTTCIKGTYKWYHESEEWSSQLIFQFKQLEIGSLKKSGLHIKWYHISERGLDTSMRGLDTSMRPLHALLRHISVILSSKVFLNYHSIDHNFVLLKLCSQLTWKHNKNTFFIILYWNVHVSQ